VKVYDSIWQIELCKIFDFETPKIPSTILECEFEPEKYYKLKEDRKIKKLLPFETFDIKY
jgi:hypothetical protein